MRERCNKCGRFKGKNHICNWTPKGVHRSPKTEFKKGHKVSEEWRKKHSEIMKKLYKKGRKMGAFHKGHKYWKHPNAIKNQFKKGLIAWNTGNGIKIKCKICGKEFKTNPSGLKRGKKYCSKECQSIGYRGSGSPGWKGGISPQNKLERTRAIYLKWRNSVFERDNFVCQECGQVGKFLHAHHIKSFSKFPELRFDINNGITLCKDCHYNNYGRNH